MMGIMLFFIITNCDFIIVNFAINAHDTHDKRVYARLYDNFFLLHF